MTMAGKLATASVVSLGVGISGQRAIAEDLLAKLSFHQLYGSNCSSAGCSLSSLGRLEEMGCLCDAESTNIKDGQINSMTKRATSE